LALLFFDNAELRAMARTAAETAEKLGGASTRIVLALKPYLAQAIVASRAGDA
jgi:3-deoxy-D-manno-octulosonic-acid transferase